MADRSARKFANHAITPRESEELNQITRLIGRTVVDVDYDETGEGCYTLAFDDGTIATFSSSGDDHTHTGICITNS